MENIKALAIKFLASLALLYIILGLFFRMTFGDVFLITLVLGVISYIIGDRMILPKTNNTTATLADFGLAFLVIWWMSNTLTTMENTFTMSLIAALGVAVFEYLFHKYMGNNVFNRNQPTQNQPNYNQSRNPQYQTEVSDEITPQDFNLNENNEKTE